MVSTAGSRSNPTLVLRPSNAEVLRPRSVGEILDAAIANLRQNYVKIVGAFLVPAIPILFLVATSQIGPLQRLRSAYQSGLSAVPVPPWINATENPVSVAAWTLEYLIVIALVVVGARSFIGQNISVAECYRYLARRIGTCLALFLMWIGVVLGPLIASVAALFAAPGVGVVAMFLAVPWTVYAWIAFRLAPVAFAVEGTRAIDSFRRSFRLVSGSWFRCLGAVFAAEFITWVINSGVQVVILIFTVNRSPSSAGFLGIGFAMVFLPALVAKPFAALVDVALYFDLRVQKEALDVEASVAAAAGEDLTLDPRMVEIKWRHRWSPVPDSRWFQ